MDTRIKTERRNFTPQARVYHYAVEDIINKEKDTVLDFGSGAARYWQNKLAKQSYVIESHDLSIPNNISLNSFDVILVSNVLNVQETRNQLRETLKQIMRFSKSGTRIVWNYAETPRKMPTLTNDDMEWLIEFWGQEKGFTVLTNEAQKNLYVTTLI
jgi:ubiquinone/menaquinone biosynthesis C-methylase UbiE